MSACSFRWPPRRGEKLQIKTAAVSAPNVSVAAAGSRVRFAAPNQVARLKLEVFSGAGESLFELSTKGSVIDWTLQDARGNRLADGTYLCVLTLKGVSGRLSQRLTLIELAGESVAARAGSPADLTAPQAEAVGPVEAEAAEVVVGGDDAPAATLLAHDGADGQVVTTAGALSFRGGDFFTGRDKELMRLSADGSLEVSGQFFARGGIRFPDGTVLESAKGARASRGKGKGGAGAGDDAPDSLSATANRLAKFADAAGTLADSAVTETGGQVGIGTGSPASLLHLAGPSGVSGITLNTPGAHRFRFQTVPAVPNWGALTLNANYNAGWLLDETATNGWFFKLDTRGGNASGTGNGLWLYRVPAGPNPHTNETAMFGVSSEHAFFAGTVGIGTATPRAAYKLDVAGRAAVSPGGSGGEIFFGSPNSETGMTISGTNRADIRFDGSTLKLVAGTGGGVPSSFNGININTEGDVGIGAAPLNAKLHVSGGDGIGIIGFSNTTNAVAGVTSSGIGVEGQSSGGVNIGVKGTTITNGTGVSGENFEYGIGVSGYSDSGTGIVARSTSGFLVEGFPSRTGGTRTFHINLNGTYVAGSDFAESLPALGGKSAYGPGDVLIMAAGATGAVSKTGRPYDRRVAGVYSTRPGVLGAEKEGGVTRVDPEDVPVAIVGIVPTKVSAENGAVRVGDQLTTSRTPGYAMRCTNRARCVGAVVGKAMEPVERGRAVIKVLVTLR